jgi:hypothetical protein
LQPAFLSFVRFSARHVLSLRLGSVLWSPDSARFGRKAGEFPWIREGIPVHEKSGTPPRDFGHRDSWKLPIAREKNLGRPTSPERAFDRATDVRSWVELPEHSSRGQANGNFLDIFGMANYNSRRNEALSIAALAAYGTEKNR